jgi:hypothetical protein
LLLLLPLLVLLLLLLLLLPGPYADVSAQGAAAAALAAFSNAALPRAKLTVMFTASPENALGSVKAAPLLPLLPLLVAKRHPCSSLLLLP